MPVTGRTVRILRWSFLALCVAMVLLCFVTTRLRIHYPFSYNESGILETLRHLRAGLPLYDAPSIRFTPFLYTPLYFYAAAFLARFTGETYVTLRLVSIIATIGCMAWMYALVRSETRRHWAALATVGCFASCYPLVYEFFDVGRVDMLYLFFVAAALYFSRPVRSQGAPYLWHSALAGLLWVAAFQTKQGVLPIALLALAYDWQRPRRIALGLGTFALAFAASFAYLQHTSHGWYSTYVFGIAGGFGFNVREGLRYLPTDILGPYGIAVLLALAAAMLAPPKSPSGWRSPTSLFYLGGSLSMIAFTNYVYAHRGAGPNALLPAYFWIAVLFGVALARLASHAETFALPTRHAVLAVLFTAGILQLAMRVYMPDKYVPSARIRADRAAFEAQLRAIPGDVMVVPFPEYAVMAGKSSYAAMDATGAVIEAKNRVIGEPLLGQYAELIHSGALAAVVTDRTAEDFFTLQRVWMPRDFLRYYPLRVAAIADQSAQMDYQAHYIYLPCTQQAAALKLDPHVDLTACAALPH